jgi:L-alanine-DL-glutamate epimerase-like enolase superfamily enzyme
MKITRVDVQTVLIPRVIPRNYETDGTWDLPAVIARVHTDAGIEGIGHAITLMPEHTRSLATLMEELGGLLIGMDPRRPEAISATSPPARSTWRPGTSSARTPASRCGGCWAATATACACTKAAA